MNSSHVKWFIAMYKRHDIIFSFQINFTFGIDNIWSLNFLYMLLALETLDHIRLDNVDFDMMCKTQSCLEMQNDCKTTSILYRSWLIQG